LRVVWSLPELEPHGSPSDVDVTPFMQPMHARDFRIEECQQGLPPPQKKVQTKKPLFPGTFYAVIAGLDHALANGEPSSEVVRMRYASLCPRGKVEPAGQSALRVSRLQGGGGWPPLRACVLLDTVRARLSAATLHHYLFSRSDIPPITQYPGKCVPAARPHGRRGSSLVAVAVALAAVRSGPSFASRERSLNPHARRRWTSSPFISRSRGNNIGPSPREAVASLALAVALGQEPLG